MGSRKTQISIIISGTKWDTIPPNANVDTEPSDPNTKSSEVTQIWNAADIKSIFQWHDVQLASTHFAEPITGSGKSHYIQTCKQKCRGCTEGRETLKCSWFLKDEMG